ncbi:MAG: response regulator [Catonella sp.]|uniref:response regulator n=1 Tax=Catonella sp. TaxID=2382125 RepID=UPI003FA01240
MDLYKIMLVDDEEEVRTSIIKKMDWIANGFEVVGDAENGRDALEKIEVLEPNVIITDIKMPYMDGLALTESLRQKFPSIKVIIFSGFDDFSYAKEAIRLGVAEYILKPVNVDELTEILKKVKAKLDEEIESVRNIDILRENYKASLPVLREQFLNKLIIKKGLFDEESINGYLREYNMDIGNANKWIACIVNIELENANIRGELLKEKELIPIYVKKFIEEKLTPYYRSVVFDSIQDAEPVIIVAIDDENSQTGLTDVMRDVCKSAKRVLGVGITVGIGRSSQTLSEISASYKTAVDAVGYKKIVGTEDVVYIHDMEPVSTGVLRFEEKDEEELISAIKFGGEDRIAEVASGLANKLDEVKVHSRQYQAYMLRIVTCIMDLMQQYEISLAGIENYMEIVSKIKDGDSFKDWLIGICNNINEGLQQKRESTSKQIINEAKEYILANYTNSELSLEIICRYLHLSPAYFSSLFKKETGQTYINYLTDIRLNKAVELLSTTDEKTYMIAEKVGYLEQNYFSYVFKKKFGVSPTKYRTGK